MKPLVSVVLSVYKNTNLEFFKQAIDSLLTQTFKDFEIVLIIDGEIPFPLKEYINSIQKKDFIRVFKNPVNKGLAFSLNKGIKEARGEYIARMDDDEICVPERLEVQYRVMEETGCDICFSNSCFIDACGRRLSILYSNKFIEELRNLLKDRYKFLKKIIVDNFIMHPSVMFKKERILEISGYNEHLKPHDHELWIKAILHNLSFEVISEPLIHIRVPQQKDYKSRVNKIRSYFVWSGSLIRRQKREIINAGRNYLEKFFLEIACRKVLCKAIILQKTPLKGLYFLAWLRDYLIGYRTTR